MNEKKIVVVGAGPAGMMAAIRASQLQPGIVLIEKNPQPGKKLLLSGKGRCNLTNACNLDPFINKFSDHGEFLRDAFKKFFNLGLMQFFETRNLKLKVERQLRVFPVNNRAGSILGVLKKELYKNKVKALYGACLKDIFIQGNKVKGLLLRDGKVIPAQRLILATGGLSFSFTGSTGEGIDMARKLGHRISPSRAGLVPLETSQQYPRLLKGLALKNIRLKFSDGKKEIISPIGELLFTDFGISGPLVLSLSGKIVDWLKENKEVYVEIDLKPALSREQLDARLAREFKLNTKKSIRNTLRSLLPGSLVDVFIDMAEIIPDKKVSQITRTERQRVISLLKNLRLNITRSRPIEEAMITRGGLDLRDINPRTMESRLIKGLYFAGEMIDVDADTGGFNLQAAFSTGYLAGESAALN
ncbi:MAG: NAD(P)/FAD-dependent oxidoreductase [Candidatus Omnitrophica bacterium]|nr:NAD(P)/FAD-dependent oxidoreductase [Candidatus Omnitrophota bacterium]MBU4346363.1 NAD(P)/FAD-dependent oxidoreductase [Candidatus Omnitrophota bacterium]MBU4473118.1 NAD(P)/FAD-dependent oxidoreductase [Candidatus Omnitrophota bacterium]MCG2705937.1 NAD(P)/FAD-dependent oxidoreductase [Candidatus Omnitrophota bacterium]